MNKVYIISILINIIVVFICGVVALGIMVSWFSGGGTDSGLDMNRIFLLALVFSPAFISTYITYRLTQTQKVNLKNSISNTSEMNSVYNNENIQIFNLKVNNMYVYHIAGISTLAWVFSTIFLIFILGEEVIALYLILTIAYPIALTIQLFLLYTVSYYKKKNMITELKFVSLLTITFLPIAVLVFYIVVFM